MASGKWQNVGSTAQRQREQGRKQARQQGPQTIDAFFSKRSSSNDPAAAAVSTGSEQGNGAFGSEAAALREAIARSLQDDSAPAAAASAAQDAVPAGPGPTAADAVSKSGGGRGMGSAWSAVFGAGRRQPSKDAERVPLCHVRCLALGSSLPQGADAPLGCAAQAAGAIVRMRAAFLRELWAALLRLVPRSAARSECGRWKCGSVVDVIISGAAFPLRCSWAFLDATSLEDLTFSGVMMVETKCKLAGRFMMVLQLLSRFTSDLNTHRKNSDLGDLYQV